MEPTGPMEPGPAEQTSAQQASAEPTSAGSSYAGPTVALPTVSDQPGLPAQPTPPAEQAGSMSGRHAAPEAPAAETGAAEPAEEPTSQRTRRANSAGRDVGPFRGVTTVRVHGGYEICRGKDDRTRRVTILTMGPSAAGDSTLRGTLGEAYEWARATGGPGAGEFLGADLTGEQPWIASLDGSGPAGVRRVFDRLVSSVRPPAPGQHTGSIPRITDTGPIPRVTDTGNVPRVGDQPPSGRPQQAHRPSGGPHAGSAPPEQAVRHPPTSLPPPPGPPHQAPHTAPPAPHQAARQEHRASGPPTGQLPRIVEPPPVVRAVPGTPPTARAVSGPGPMGQQRPGQEMLPPPPPPPMPAYQGRAYTAAPRPIAPPGAGRALPIMLLVLGLISLGVLVLLVGAYVVLFGG